MSKHYDAVWKGCPQIYIYTYSDMKNVVSTPDNILRDIHVFRKHEYVCETFLDSIENCTVDL